MPFFYVRELNIKLVKLSTNFKLKFFTLAPPLEFDYNKIKIKIIKAST